MVSSAVSLAIQALCIIIDLLLLTLLSAVVFIIVTGGGVLHVFEVTIRARSVGNPISFVAGLAVLRYALRRWPFLGIAGWQLGPGLRRGTYFIGERLVAEATGLFRRPLLSVTLLSIVVFLIRVLLAWAAPGFFSGDDVEIHEMTLGVLFHRAWPVWDLRCAFFPMVFVYPAQAVAFALGASSPETLVLAGRVAVALFSTAAIPLTWLTARRLAPGDRRLAALSVLLLSINKLQMSFGSSELPRPVSTVFVLAAFSCLIQRRLLQSAAAGVLLGIAVALRFSEVVFLPAALIVTGRRYRTDGVVLLLTAALTAAAIIGIADALFWGRPFHSLVSAFGYTLMQGESTRGYEPSWAYLQGVPAWSTFVIVALAVAGSSRTAPESWWLWMPIALLSLLPHKESRYLLPVIPFLCIAAARGVLRTTEWIRHCSQAPGWRRSLRELAAPLLALSVLHDVGGWRLPRSNEGIRLVRHLRQSGGTGIAAQDVWRLGGRPYLSPLEPIMELPPPLLADPNGLAAVVKQAKWVALRYRVARTGGDAPLRAVGFERDASWQGEDYVLYRRHR